MRLKYNTADSAACRYASQTRQIPRLARYRLINWFIACSCCRQQLRATGSSDPPEQNTWSCTGVP